MVRYAELKGFYEIEKTIGCGGFAKVKLATHVATGERVAIKIMDKERLGPNLPRIQLEIEALKDLSHPHICKLYQVIDTSTHIFMVLEYCSGGELFDHIVEKNRLSETESRIFFQQIVSAVAYLHSLGYAHRDLKPENVLLDKDENLKLIDFGLCAKPNGGMQCPLFTSCGSPTYAAPELILGQKYIGSEVDVWSMGVLLYALLAGYLPFDDQNIENLYKKILAGKYEEPSWMSISSRRLIKSMLQTDPKRRIKVTELLSHPWLTLGVIDSVKLIPVVQKLKDNDCISLMARKSNTSPEEKWKTINKWVYNYDTATYLLLLLRKRRGLPLKLSSSSNLLNRFLADTIANGNSNSTTTQKSNLPVRVTNARPGTPRPKAVPVKQEAVDVLKQSENVIAVKTPDKVFSPSTNENFVEPRRPSIRRPLKRIRTPNLDGDHSPVPTKITPGKKLERKIDSPAVDASTTPSTPQTKHNLSNKETRNTPGSATPKTGSTRRAVIGSIGRSLNRVRHALTPRRNDSGTPGAELLGTPTGAVSSTGPQLLTGKGLCNVSTTPFHDPDTVMSELKKALQKKGISCTQKGYILRGKMDGPCKTSSSCSFELEVCLVTPGGSSTTTAPACVGVRRKRLKGDAWRYKKVCEEVLALAAAAGEDLHEAFTHGSSGRSVLV